jgi:hypothetical protein
MKANIVKPIDIAAVTFDSGTLIILKDDEAFGDEDILRSIAAQADQARPSIPNLPSVPFPVRDKSVCIILLSLTIGWDLRRYVELSAHVSALLL